MRATKKRDKITKRVWVIAIYMLLIGVSVIAYYYFGNKDKSSVKVNVCSHLSDYNNETISILKDLKIKWIRTDWIIGSKMRDYSQTLQNNNINLLTIIDFNTFDFKTPSLKEWNDTITEIVVSDGFNNTDAVEIWNEPNAGAFVDPDTYFEMLKSAYSIIKNYTQIDVVFSGVSPNIENWRDYLVDVFSHNEVVDYFDVMGIHLYDDMTINVETLQFVEGLSNKPIWVTEIGYPSIDSEELQATYLISFYERITRLVDKLFIYELLDTSGLFPEKENHFGLLTIDGTKKEAYYRVWEIGR